MQSIAPERTVFLAKAIASQSTSSDSEPRQLALPFIPPSKRLDLPSNVIVTRVDCGAWCNRKPRQGRQHHAFLASNQRTVMPDEFGGAVDDLWTFADQEWETLSPFIHPVAPGTLAVWRVGSDLPMVLSQLLIGKAGARYQSRHSYARAAHQHCTCYRLVVGQTRGSVYSPTRSRRARLRWFGDYRRRARFRTTNAAVLHS